LQILPQKPRWQLGDWMLDVSIGVMEKQQGKQEYERCIRRFESREKKYINQGMQTSKSRNSTHSKQPISFLFTIKLTTKYGLIGSFTITSQSLFSFEEGRIRNHLCFWIQDQTESRLVGKIDPAVCWEWFV